MRHSSIDMLSSPLAGTACTFEQYSGLQRELVQLRDTFDQMKKTYEKKYSELMVELDDEKKARATFQIELDRLKRQIQPWSAEFRQQTTEKQTCLNWRFAVKIVWLVFGGLYAAFLGFGIMWIAFQGRLESHKKRSVFQWFYNAWSDFLLVPLDR